MAKDITIMVIDDDPVDADILQRYLEELQEWNIAFLYYSDPESARVELTKQHVSLIFLDYLLGARTGLEVLKMITDSGHQQPVIFLTGQGNETVAVEAMKNGAMDYLVKGELSTDLLRRSIRYTLEQHQVRKELEQTRQVERHLANYDNLTNLANRKLFFDRLQQVIRNADRYMRQTALLFLDLDNFKAVNDTWGHQAGDQLLMAISKRLTSCVREVDTVARLGGDEFAIILQSIIHPQDAAKIANKICAALTKPFRLVEEEFNISISIGISLYPYDTKEMELLMKYADLAMFEAKQTGKNNFKFYSQSVNSKLCKQMVLEKSIDNAFNNNEFIIYYQPLVNTTTWQIIGMEALIRWQHPEFGLLEPEKFIPMAEGSRLISQIDEWVLKNACAQNKTWQKSGFPPLIVSINISSLQFKQNLAGLIDKVLNTTGLEAKFLSLDITESSIMQNVEQSIAILDSVYNIGCQITIDDFGIGFSSLNYLKKLHINAFKIARPFVSNISKSVNDDAIIKTITAMAHNLNIEVIAKGVEEKKQLDFLKEQNCNTIQGYIFSKPLSTSHFTNLFKQKKHQLKDIS